MKERDLYNVNNYKKDSNQYKVNNCSINTTQYYYLKNVLQCIIRKMETPTHIREHIDQNVRLITLK